MGLMLNFVPVVLTHVFHFKPLAVGAVAGGGAAAKIFGSLTASRLARVAGSRRAVGAMLGGSALAAAVLAGTHQAWLYVALTLASTFLAIGVWPVVVDGALARVSPEERHGLAVVWNVREYVAIAAATVLGGYLLDLSARPTLMLIAASGLLAIAADLGAGRARPPRLRAAHGLDPTELQCGVEQGVRAVHAVLPVGVLLRVVADAAGRRDEDHPARRDSRERLRVVAGSRRELDRREPEAVRRRLDRVAHACVEGGRLPVSDRRDVDAERMLGCSTARLGEQGGFERVELRTVEGAELE